jgi:molybdate/tungstate transport system substrate-binding protein
MAVRDSGVAVRSASWRFRGMAGLAVVLVSACASRDQSSPRSAATATQTEGPLVVFTAGSLAQPLRAVLDSFAARTGVRYEQEPGASLELARKITELGRRPDVIALADTKVFTELLMPAHVGWYARFAHNRIVLAYAPGAQHADEITRQNWRQVILRPDVEVGRADPDQDPSGYRTLLVWQLAERFYHEPGLSGRLLRATPPRNVRPRESDLTALLQTHTLDYAWTYQNLADDHGLAHVDLPDSIDLGTAADSAFYAMASTRVAGRTRGDTLVVRGEPIVYAIAVARAAPHRMLGERFVAFLLSPVGQRILRARHLDALEHGGTVGDSVPLAVARAAR